MKALIWSKDNCGHCASAKQLLESKGLQYEERNISHGKWTKEHLLAAVPTARTMPQIFLDDKHVGGYPELRKLLV